MAATRAMPAKPARVPMVLSRSANQKTSVSASPELILAHRRMMIDLGAAVGSVARVTGEYPALVVALSHGAGYAVNIADTAAHILSWCAKGQAAPLSCHTGQQLLGSGHRHHQCGSAEQFTFTVANDVNRYMAGVYRQEAHITDSDRRICAALIGQLPVTPQAISSV